MWALRNDHSQLHMSHEYRIWELSVLIHKRTVYLELGYTKYYQWHNGVNDRSLFIPEIKIVEPDLKSHSLLSQQRL